MSVRFSAAVIFVEDIKKSRTFYETVLGQEVESDYGECVVFAGGFAIWEKAYAHNLIFGGRAARFADKAHELELYFETEAMKEVRLKLKSAGAQEVHPMMEQPWGQRVLRVYDPDRHIVEIGETTRIVVQRLLENGVSAEEIAERYDISIEKVHQLAQAE